MKSKKIIGLDLGYRQTKLYSDKCYSFPSIIGNPSVFEIDEFYTVKSTLDNLEIRHVGDLYYVGNRAYDTSNARMCIDTDKTNSINEKVIYKAALSILCEKQDKLNISVVTGLPVEDFKQVGLKQALIDNMAGTHTIETRDTTYQVSVDDVVVIPQSAGAYYDYVLDDNGEIKEEAEVLVKGTVIVIDIGYKTTDIITMVNGSYDSKRSFTIVKGMRDIHKELARMLRFNYNRKFELHQLDLLCRSGILSDNGNVINITDHINASAKPIAEAILTEINATIGDIRIANKILGAGGTVNLLSPYMTAYYKETYEQLSDSEGANARGYGKYGKMIYETDDQN